MVARNFAVQDVSNSRLLQEPDDDDNGFITLQELKPVIVQQSMQTYQRSYYELPNMIDDPCSSSLSFQSNQNSSSTIDDNSSVSCSNNRKRKTYFPVDNDIKDDCGEDNKSIKSNDENKKQNHSEVEKRRRDKMNTYITELSSMVPMCHAMSRKLDKLTVLRIAVQHLKSIRGALPSYTEGHYKPSLLSDQELKHVILQNKCALAMLPVKTDVPQGASRLCPGARRSFFCRMKCNSSSQVKEEADTTTGYHRRKKYNSDKKYNVIQCTGYLKSWAPAKIGLEEQEEGDGESCNLSCLVAIGRILPHISTIAANCQGRPNVKQIQFISRHALDGKFLFIDQRSTLVLGFLPQELLGTSMYEYFHHEDIQSLAEYHKVALQSTNAVTTEVYRFRTKSGSFIKIQSEWKSFKNPWTKEIENFISKNNLILTDFRTVESSASQSDRIRENINFLSQPNGKDMHLLISNHIEVSKIGRQIADQVMDSQRRGGDSSSSSSPDPESSFSLPILPDARVSPSIQSTEEQKHSLLSEYSDPKFYDIRNVSLSNVATDPSGTTDEGMMEMIEDDTAR
uniref:Protein cycle-like n=1 Tax=Diabrotica virgifera virgifera TaxID=50390 RepID=A0A6P7FSG6_DIAVI